MGFGKLYLTKVGQALQYKCQAGKTLNFLKFVLGSGELGSQAISELTSLIHEEMSVNISKLKVTDTKVTLGISFNNANVEQGFYFREIGIIAEDPDTKEEILFMYGNARDSADYIDKSTGDVLEKILDVDMVVSDVENITATLDSSLIFATQKELEELNEKVESKQNDLKSKNVSGTEIELTDAGEVESILHVEGNSEQDAEPSPSYPSEIRSVKSKSDNLLNLTGISNNDVGTLENGVITLTWNSGFDCFLLHNNASTLTGLQSEQNYTVSFKHKGNAIRLYDCNTSDGITTQNDSDYTQYSFVVSGVTEIKLDAIRSDETGIAYIKDIQVNKGSTVLPYQPYGYYPVEVKVEGENVEPIIISLPLGDIILRSMPNGTRDTFERVDGLWNKSSKIGSVVFDGSDDEDWKVTTETSTYMYVHKNTLTYPQKTSGKGLCTHYINDGTTNIGRFILGNNYAFSFFTEYTSVSEWKAWLNANPITVDYELETTVYTPITDTALINALDVLEELILHQGYNHITATAVNGVKAYLDLTYFINTQGVKDIKTYIEIKAKKIQKYVDDSIASAITDALEADY